MGALVEQPAPDNDHNVHLITADRQQVTVRAENTIGNVVTRNIRAMKIKLGNIVQ